LDTESHSNQRIGNYELLDEIARGGMGIVYRARQSALNRVVALKVLPGAVFPSPQSRQRFLREAQTAASLHHPGIVTIHEIGEHLGQPYIAMEWVDGASLTERLSKGNIPPKSAAEILRSIALAIAHAHERSVVHRDLKPANILIRGEAEPVVTDFGLAKFTQSGATLTLDGTTIGSPGYMPPERIRGLRDEAGVSVTEDVYGLGAILYHCLAGRPPFVADSIASVMALTQTEDPLPPQLLNPSIPRDLQTICLRCLEKSPSQRYASAAELAAELGRFLSGEPIVARPLGWPQRLWRRSRRHPLIAVLSVALAVSIISGTTASLFAWRTARQQSEARRVALYSSNVTAAAAAMNEGHPARARALLDAAAPADGESDLRGPEWFTLKHLLRPQEVSSTQAHAHILTSLSWHPDGTRLLSASHDGSIKLWHCDSAGRLDSGTTLVPAGTPRINSIQWLPDGSAFLAAEARSIVRLRQPEISAPLWEIAGQSFSLSTDGTTMAVSTSGPFYYDEIGAVSLWRMNYLAKPEQLETFPQKARAVALSPGARFLAMSRAGGRGADDENGVWLFDLQNRATQPRLLPTPGSVWSLRFSPDNSQLLAAPFVSGKVDVLRFDTATGNPLPVSPGGTLRPTSISFARGRGQVVVSTTDRHLRTLEPDGGTSDLSAAHENEIWCSAIQPQQKWLASGDKDGTLKIFPFPLPKPALGALSRFPHFRYAPISFSPDSSAMMLVPSAMDAPALLHRTDGAPSQTLPKRGVATGLDSSGNLVEWISSENRIVSGDHSWSLPKRTHGVRQHPYLTADGRFFFLIDETGHATRVNLTNGAIADAGKLLSANAEAAGEFICASVSHDGRRAAIATWKVLAVHDFESGTTRRFSNDPHWARDIAFSKDGTLMTTAGIDGNIVLRALPSGEIHAVLKGHIEEASAVTFSPDGHTLVSSELGHGLRFWRLDTLREVLHLPLPDSGDALRFSPDGRHLAVVVSPQGAPPDAASVVLLPVK
jgi:serine/threonine protein kinase/Tol biopolymer transport system component